MTTYPISKIRSGEVAVKLTSLEQYVKLCEIVDGKNNYIPNYSENKYHGRVFGYCIEPLENHELFNRTLIDFTQIDWEEGKEEIVDIVEKVIDIISQFGDGETEFHTRDIQHLIEELTSLKAENDRLKRENERLVKFNNELSNLMQKQILDNIKLQQPSPNQELTLHQRMAWELYVSGFNHGIADKWTIAECYRSAKTFLNYKGGENE
jgi:hypothetical protein